MASLYYQHSIMRRAFIISGVDKKYRVAKEVRNNDRFFGKNLFKHLQHMKFLGKVMEDLALQKQAKKPL